MPLLGGFLLSSSRLPEATHARSAEWRLTKAGRGELFGALLGSGTGTSASTGTGGGGSGGGGGGFALRGGLLPVLALSELFDGGLEAVEQLHLGLPAGNRKHTYTKKGNVAVRQARIAWVRACVMALPCCPQPRALARAPRSARAGARAGGTARPRRFVWWDACVCTISRGSWPL